MCKKVKSLCILTENKIYQGMEDASTYNNFSFTVSTIYYAILILNETRKIFNASFSMQVLT